MVIYSIKNLLPIKDTIKVLPTSGINSYINIKTRRDSVLQKQQYVYYVLCILCMYIIYIYYVYIYNIQIY